MNRIYRSVWNEISRTFVAAAETVRGRGKPSSSCADAAPAARRPALARRRPMMLALEQRFMFDGAAAAPVAEAAAAAAVAEAHAAIQDAPAPVEVRAAEPAKDGGKKEVVFVDTSVADYKTLEAGIRDGVAIVEIDGAKDGLAQIAKWAEANSGYDSISILGHGSQATLNLGTTTLTATSLGDATTRSELATIGGALTSDGDLLLYGCDVANGTEGEAFIAALASATGADVAASNDATGATSRGGDWTLEKQSGTVETLIALNDSAQHAYDRLLALPSAVQDFTAPTYWENNTGVSTVDGFSLAESTGATLGTDPNYYPDFYFGQCVATDGSGKPYYELTWTADNTDLGTFDLDKFTIQNYGTGGCDFQLDFTASNGQTQSYTSTGNGGSASETIDIDQTKFNDITSFKIRITIAATASSNPTDAANLALKGMVLTDLKGPSAAPVVANLSGSSVTYTEGGSAVLLDVGSDATVSDSDSTNFDGGKVTVSVTTGRVSAEDQLSIVNQGTAAGQIGVSGANVNYGGTLIGTFTGGTGTSDLVVTLNASATPAAVQALLRDITYSNSNASDPSTATRTVRVTVNDGDGGTSTNQDITVGVTAVNDAPVASGDSALANEAGTVSGTDGIGNVLSNDSDPDNATKTVTAVRTGGSEGSGAAGAVGSALAGRYGTLTLNTDGSYRYVVDNANAEVNALALNATLAEIFNYTVSDGSLGDDAVLTITIRGANDKPTVSAGSSSARYVEDGPAVVVDAGITLADVDSPQLQYVSATISSGYVSGDTLRFTNQNGITGTWNAVDHMLRLSGYATLADFQAALRSVTFAAAPGDNPTAGTRTISWRSTDDHSAFSDTATSSVTVTPVNDAPTGVSISKTTVSTFDSDNTVVGSLSATDVDGTGLTYSIVSVVGPLGSSDPAFFNIVGSDLRATDPSTLAAGTYTLVVRATDAGGLHYDKTLSIKADNALVVTTASNETYTSGTAYAQLGGGTGISLDEAIGFANENTGVTTIRFADGITSLSFSYITITRTLTLDFGSANVSLNAGGKLNANTNATLIINSDAGGAVVMNSELSGSGALTKTGGGSLTLAGAKYIYWGATTISGGELIVSGVGDFSQGARQLAIDDGAKLTLDRDVPLTRLSGNGTVDLKSATLTVDGGYDSTFAGTITGSGSLVMAGNGILTLTGANDYSGTTTISSGCLVVADDANLGSGALVLSGGKLQVTADARIDNAITLAADATISTDQTLRLSGAVSGSGSLVKRGSGTLTLAGANSYSGTTSVYGGTLELTGGSAIADAGAVYVYEEATLRLGANEAIGSLEGNQYVGSGSVVLGGWTLTVGGNGSSTTYDGVISGSGALAKAGSGTLTLGGANNTSGWATTVQGGTLAIAGDANLGGGALTINGGTLKLSSAAIIDNAITITGNATLDAADALMLSGVIDGTGTLTKSGSGTLTLGGTNALSGGLLVAAGALSVADGRALGTGMLTLSAGTTFSYTGAGTGRIANAITFTGDATISHSAALTLSGKISGDSGKLTKEGAGTLTLTGTNTYKGETVVNDGTLAIEGDAKLGSGALTLANDAKLELSGTTTISNAIVLTCDATTIVTDSGAVATLSGTVSGTTLTKSGGGTLILGGGAPKSFNVTRVTGGTLQIDTALGGVVSAQAGTTISGHGSVSASLTIESGATLAPGAAGVGTLTVGSTLTLNGTLAVELSGDASYDRIVAQYGVSYGTDSAISVTYLGNYAPTGATTFRLIDNAGATSGEFKGLEQGALYKSGDNDYTVSYSASGTGGSSSLTLTSLPRPAVSGVTSSAGDGLHKIGDVITISVAFDRAVNVAGTPTLLLETGTIDRVATYLSGNGSNILTFSYTVQAGDTAADLDYASSGALALAGGTIADAATGKPAVLTLAAPGAEHSLGQGNAIVIDGNAPTASIVLSSPSLRIGETAQVTITFSEAVTGFDASDLSVANGALSGLSTSDKITWTATFTPTTGISDTSKVITLANAGVTDLAGNAGAGVTASANYAVDTLRPTATIVVADSVLAAGETSRVTITFSEAVSGFTDADLSVENGTLSGLSSSDGGVTWSATFTPSAGISDTSNVITLTNTGVIDLAGNAGTDTTDSNKYVVDTLRPTATIIVAQSALKADDSALVTITFSEAVTGFTNDDLTIANGTLSAVSSSDGGITWTATFTPNVNVADSSNVITLNTAGVTDLAGSAGSGTTLSNYYAIDSVRPSATIVLADPSLTIGETTQVTITFSEAVSGFDASDLTVANGSLSALTTSDNITWSATFTPNAEVSDTSNVITLIDHSVENGAGNANSGAATSANYAVLTARTLSYSATTLAEAAANDGSISSTATITLANESFAGADGSALGTVSNVPAGLTAQLIKVDATHARLSLTGKASAHANAQDIGNLTVSFADGDFVGSPAAKVAGATTTLAIDFADAAATPAPVADPVVPAPVVVSAPVVVPPSFVVAPPQFVPPPATPTMPLRVSPAPAGDTLQFIAPASPLALAASPQADSSLASLAAPQLAAAAVAPAEAARAPVALASVGEGSSQSPAIVTPGGSFQVVVASGVSPADGLVVNRGVADQSVGSGTVSQFAIPSDAFAASNVGAVVTLSAQQSNGAPLPAWVRFDAASGRFEGQPPAGFTGELTIRIVARDAQGHEAVTTFKIKVGEKSGRAQLERPGRAGLTEQLRLIGRPHPALERLARLAAQRHAA